MVIYLPLSSKNAMKPTLFREQWYNDNGHQEAVTFIQNVKIKTKMQCICYHSPARPWQPDLPGRPDDFKPTRPDWCERLKTQNSNSKYGAGS